MIQVRGGCCPGRIGRAMTAIALVTVAGVTAACRERPASTAPESSSKLRIGWGQGQATSANPNIGLRQLSQRLSFEGLARTAEDGRMLPSLAESWTPGPDGRSLTIKLRSNITFHDGSRANADVVASILPGALKAFLGPLVS